MLAYMITHHRWVFVVFLLLPLSVVFGESAHQQQLGNACAPSHTDYADPRRRSINQILMNLTALPHTETFLYARNMLQFWLRKRSSKKHEAKVQDIRRQVRFACIMIDLCGGVCCMHV